jgi:transcriptional regulator with XRE-family HTH domain
MARNKPDPEVVAEAVAARRAGVSLRDVARVAGVSPTTVMRWEASAAAAPPAPAPDVMARAKALVAGAPAPDPEPDADPAPPEDDALAYARWQRRRILREGERAALAGNHAANQKAQRDAVAMSTLIARLEKASENDADVIRVTRGEVDQAMAGVREKVRAVLDRPLLCAACSRALNVDIAEGKV